MKLVPRFAILFVYIEIVSSLPKEPHPPVWEYTHQYELFEKIYGQVQNVWTDMRILSSKLSDRKCPPNWKKGNRTCYFLALYRKLDWFQSQEACERIGGHLAIVYNEQVNTLITNYINGVFENEELAVFNVWIGGNRNTKDGSWRWVSGENVSYVNWESNSTSSETGGGRHCIVSTEQYWNVRRCSKNYHYLCERQPILL